MIKLNETPVRTSRNFNINNIKLENVNIPKKVKIFDNLEMIGEGSKISVENTKNDINLTYGMGEAFSNLSANQSLKINIDSKTNKELICNFNLDNDNNILVDNLTIIANEGTKSTIIINYISDEKCSGFHNGIIKLLAKQDANINVIVTNLLNYNTNNFISIENELEENAKVNYTIVDFGGKNSISNLYSNIKGNNASNEINTIYLGNEEQLFDINYIADLKGEKTNVNIEVQGALSDSARKHFKGTIDFKRGAKKAKGNENESCMLLSDKAKSLALPMLLCSEEDVEGNHSSSSGKLDEKTLFYIMSRGFELKEAMKLAVRAKFNNILNGIKNEKLREKILAEIDKKLI